MTCGELNRFALEHDAEKWKPGFGRHHALTL